MKLINLIILIITKSKPVPEEKQQIDNMSLILISIYDYLITRYESDNNFSGTTALSNLIKHVYKSSKVKITLDKDEIKL